MKKIILKTTARSIINIGNTFYFSLPKMWLTTNGIEKGDTLSIDILSDGSLSIKPPFKIQGSSKDSKIRDDMNENQALCKN
jgi:hypothetical protein